MPNLTADENRVRLMELENENDELKKELSLCTMHHSNAEKEISSLKKQIEELKKEILILRNENLEEGDACR